MLKGSRMKFMKHKLKIEVVLKSRRLQRLELVEMMTEDRVVRKITWKVKLGIRFF